MRYDYQGGPARLANDFALALDVEVSYAGLWHSLNDHFNYRMGTEGFGVAEQTRRRKSVSNDFFEGDFEVRSVRASVKRTLDVWVYGADQVEVQENIARLVDEDSGWFSQDAYNVRVRLNEYAETWLCDSADYSVDGSHIFLHNCMARVRLTFSTAPKVSKEILL
jgi:hypothetical protein